MAAAIDGIVLFDGIAYEIQRLLGKGKATPTSRGGLLRSMW